MGTTRAPKTRQSRSIQVKSAKKDKQSAARKPEPPSRPPRIRLTLGVEVQAFSVRYPLSLKQRMVNARRDRAVYVPMTAFIIEAIEWQLRQPTITILPYDPDSDREGLLLKAPKAFVQKMDAFLDENVSREDPPYEKSRNALIVTAISNYLDSLGF